jgi:integrase/recombinase XerC
MDGPLNARFSHFLHERRLSPRTIQAYLSDLQAFITWFEMLNQEPFSSAAIVRRDLMDWRDHLRQSCSPATLNRRLSSLRAFYRWAQREGLASTDPSSGVSSVKVPASHKAVSASDVEALLASARRGGNLRDHALLALLVDTGLRPAEIARLPRGALQLDPGHAWLTVSAGRGMEPRRLPLGARARAAVRACLAEAGDIQSDEPLFSSPGGNAVSPFVIWYTVRKVAGEAGIKGMTPTRLRDYAARRMIADPQVGLVEAGARLGQARLESLVKYLGNAIPLNPQTG